MKIAILGSRGIPAKYGGFETFADGLSQRLVKQGHQVTVSCEYEHPDSRLGEYEGVELEYFPIKAPDSYLLRKFYENLSDIYFLIKLSRHYDLVYFLGIEVGMFLFIPKLLKRNLQLMVNIDGVMWQRSKFNWLEKSLLKINHDLATVFADTIVADSEEMKSFVHPRYHDKTIYLSYGVDIPPEVPWNAKYLKTIKNFQDNSLNAHDYFLVIARLEPENNIHTIVQAYAQAKADSPLVVIGDYTSQKYEDEINKIIRDSSGENIQFLGSVYNKKILDMLRQNCKAYLHGHSVGGTNPSLLEAAVCSDTIIAHDNPFNREVCQDCALYFQDSQELRHHIEKMDINSEGDPAKSAFKQVHQEYSWDKISSDYQKVINSLVI